MCVCVSTWTAIVVLRTAAQPEDSGSARDRKIHIRQLLGERESSDGQPSATESLAIYVYKKNFPQEPSRFDCTSSKWSQRSMRFTFIIRRRRRQRRPPSFLSLSMPITRWPRSPLVSELTGSRGSNRRIKVVGNFTSRNNLRTGLCEIDHVLLPSHFRKEGGSFPVSSRTRRKK